MTDHTKECGFCGEPGATESMPFVGAEDERGIMYFHEECELRNVLGGLKHQAKICSCFLEGGDSNPPAGMTDHAEALEVMRLVKLGTWNYG